LFGKRKDPGKSDLQVQPGVALPFHDEESYRKWHLRKVQLVRGGTRATATIESISDVGRFGGRGYVRMVTARIEPEGAEPFDTSTVVVEVAAISPLPLGATIDVFFDSYDSTMVAFALQSPGQGQPTVRWRVSARCPSCGGPVDTAVACTAAHPMCDHCRQPLPVEPLT
jgi:hypothetical protein